MKRKNEVAYRDDPYRGGTKEERCANCTMFRPPSMCSAVEGPVTYQGWCTLHDFRKDAK